MKVVVTGSSGFLGTYLVNDLITEGYEVLGIDIKPQLIVLEGFTHSTVDLRATDQLKETIHAFEPDAIVHLAARTDLDEKTTLQGYDANIQGVENLIDVIRSSPTIERCIFTSSQLVCRIGYVPSHYEDYCPSTLYGQSKVLSEQIVRQSDGGGVTWCIVRPTTVWGPGMNKHYQSFFRMLQKGLYFHIGSKPLFKSYSYVGNISYQYRKLLEIPVDKMHQNTFYLADYEPISLRAWVDAFQAELQAKPVRTLPENVAKVIAKLGDSLNYVGFSAFPFNSFRLNNILTEYQFDTTAMEKIAGSLPYSMEQGVKDTSNWLREGKYVDG